jgi:hypothetical protein
MQYTPPSGTNLLITLAALKYNILNFKNFLIENSITTAVLTEYLKDYPTICIDSTNSITTSGFYNFNYWDSLIPSFTAGIWVNRNTSFDLCPLNCKTCTITSQDLFMDARFENCSKPTTGSILNYAFVRTWMPNYFYSTVTSPQMQQYYPNFDQAFRFPGKYTFLSTIDSNLKLAIFDSTLTYTSGKIYTDFYKNNLESTSKFSTTKNFIVEFWLLIDSAFDTTATNLIYFYMNPGFVLYLNKADKLFYVSYRYEWTPTSGGTQEFVCTVGFSIPKFSWQHLAFEAISTPSEKVNVYLNMNSTPIASASGTSCYTTPLSNAGSLPVFGNILFQQTVPLFQNNSGTYSITTRTLTWGSALYKNIKVWDNSPSRLLCYGTTSLYTGTFKIDLDALKYFNYVDPYFNNYTVPCRLLMWFPLNESVKQASPVEYNYNLVPNTSNSMRAMVQTKQTSTPYDNIYSVYNICAADPSGNPTFFSENLFLSNPNSSFCTSCTPNPTYTGSEVCLQCGSPGTYCNLCGNNFLNYSKLFGLDMTQGTCYSKTSTSNRYLTLLIPQGNSDINSINYPRVSTAFSYTYLPIQISSTNKIPFTIFFFYKFFGQQTYNNPGSSLIPIISVFPNSAKTDLSLDNQYKIGYDFTKNQFYVCICIGTGTNCCNVILYYSKVTFTTSTVQGKWLKIAFGFDSKSVFLVVDNNTLVGSSVNTENTYTVKTGINNKPVSVGSFAIYNLLFGQFGNIYTYNTLNKSAIYYSMSSSYSTGSLGVFVPYLFSSYPYTLSGGLSSVSIFDYWENNFSN